MLLTKTIVNWKIIKIIWPIISIIIIILLIVFVNIYVGIKDKNNDQFSFEFDSYSKYENDCPTTVIFYTSECISHFENLYYPIGKAHGYIWRGELKSNEDESVLHNYTWQDNEDSIIADFYLKPNNNLIIYPNIEIIINMFFPVKSSVFLDCYIEIGSTDMNKRVIDCGRKEIVTNVNKFYWYGSYYAVYNDPIIITESDFVRLRLEGGFIINPLKPTPFDIMNSSKPQLLTCTDYGTKILMKVNPITIQDKIINNNYKNNFIYFLNINNSISNISQVYFNIDSYDKSQKVYYQDILLNEKHNNWSGFILVNYENLAKYLSKYNDRTKNKYIMTVNIIDERKNTSYILQKDLILEINIIDLKDNWSSFLNIVNVVGVLIGIIIAIYQIIIIKPKEIYANYR